MGKQSTVATISKVEAHIESVKQQLREAHREGQDLDPLLFRLNALMLERDAERIVEGSPA